jgi:thiol-disulfide isomerase/thioredoxin
MKLLRILIPLAALAGTLHAGALSGRRVPSFTLPDGDARFHDILDLRGKLVLIDVMQTGCSHCQTLAEQLEKVQSKSATSWRASTSAIRSCSTAARWCRR